jgi:NADPH:quinone reductase-like Zn-dependent oxidoreductase
VYDETAQGADAGDRMAPARPREERDMTALAASTPRTMQQVVYRRYGSPDAIELRDAEIPVVPADRVLVRVKASSVNALEWHSLRGEPFMVRVSDGLRRPKDGRLGTDVAGVVEQVGTDVSDFAPGDRVFGVCAGAYAAFAVARPERLVTIPDSISFEEAATVPVAATTALQAVRDHAGVAAGQSVLVHGAGGGVGMFAVEIAKSFGAKVTASSYRADAERLRSIGADDIVDSAKDDFTQLGRRFDAIIDVAGTRSLGAGLKALNEGGRYVSVGGPSGRWLKPLDRTLNAVIRRKLLRQPVIVFLARIRLEDLRDLRDRLEAGTLHPVIAATFPLRDVAEAIRFVEERRAFGKVVITV